MVITKIDVARTELASPHHELQVQQRCVQAKGKGEEHAAERSKLQTALTLAEQQAAEATEKLAAAHADARRQATAAAEAQQVALSRAHTQRDKVILAGL